MPILVLFRHAKAAPALPDQRDFDRPLTERGRQDADRMGAVLAHYPIDQVLVSAAVRTQETWQGAAAKFETAPPVDVDPELYLAGGQKLVRRLRELQTTTRAAIVVGHNPDMHEIAVWLAGEDSGRIADALRQRFPTAAAAIFELDIGSWNEIGPRRAKLQRFVIAGELPS